MKILVAIMLVGLSLASNAQNRKFLASLECSASAFRTSSSEADDAAKLFFDIVEIDGKIYLEEFGGNIYASDYYGIFHGKMLAEKPSTRAIKYKNYYRFPDFDAAFTAGSESGMWGYLVVNKDLTKLGSGNGDSIDAHYVFQAGDHMGGTVDFLCKKPW